MGRSIRLGKTDRTIPVARSEGLLVEPVGSETVIYDLETKQAHCLKPLAALVFESCDGEQSIATIAQLASERLSATVTADEVAEAVSQLEHLALLDTPLIVHDGNGAMSSNGNGVSRREMLRRVGFAGAAAAVATPLVTSIVPSAALAKSLIPGGCSGCGKNKDCATGHCCQTNPGKQCDQQCCVVKNNSCHIVVCHCMGGSNPGANCTNPSVSCSGGGTCVCQCTVCASDLTNGCPGHCPTGSSLCCTTTC